MIKYILILFTTFATAQIQHDKVLHFGTGAVIGSTAYFIAYDITKSKNKAFMASIGSSLLAGLAKELYDSRKGGTGFDNNDLLATGLGGLTIGITINIFKK